MDFEELASILAQTPAGVVRLELDSLIPDHSAAPTGPWWDRWPAEGRLAAPRLP